MVDTIDMSQEEIKFLLDTVYWDAPARKYHPAVGEKYDNATFGEWVIDMLLNFGLHVEYIAWITGIPAKYFYLKFFDGAEVKENKAQSNSYRSMTDGRYCW